MSSAILKLHYRAMHKRVSALHVARINWKLVYGMFALSAMVLLVFYIVRVNELTRGSFLIKGYNKELATVVRENSQLQTEFAQNDFLGSATLKARELNFEKTGKITYVQILQGSLAEAK